MVVVEVVVGLFMVMEGSMRVDMVVVKEVITDLVLLELIDSPVEVEVVVVLVSWWR